MTDSIRDLRLCVVCAGNICRSPIAEIVLRKRFDAAGLGDKVSVESAGTGNWHAGEPADRRALAVLDRHGYDGSAHRARQFRRTWFDAIDVVLAMDRDNLADLRRLAPDDDARAKIQLLRAYDPVAVADDDTDVPDPYYGNGDSFERVLSMIERAAPGLTETVRREVQPTPDPTSSPTGSSPTDPGVRRSSTHTQPASRGW